MYMNAVKMFSKQNLRGDLISYRIFSQIIGMELGIKNHKNYHK